MLTPAIRTFIPILILTFVVTCTQQDPFVRSRLITAHKFVDCLKTNTPDKILDYAYAGVDRKINDKEARDFFVDEAHDYISRFGIASENKWILEYNPRNNFERLVIRIPIFRGYDSTTNLIKLDLILHFPPPEISDKLFSYEIEGENDIEREKPLLAPEEKDTIKNK